MKIQAIMAVDEKGGIGYRNGLLKHNKQDLAFFSGFTQGKTCIVGYNTIETLPVLANRKVTVDNINLSPTQMFHSLRKCSSDIVIIGGAKTYEKYSFYVEELYITTFKDFVADKCDTYINLNSFKHLTKHATILENKDIKVEVWTR